MIIGIDLCSLAYGTGVSNYTLNLLRHLLRIDKVNQYKLFYSSLRQPLPLDVARLESVPRVKIYRFYLPPTLLTILWNRLHILPIEFFIGKCDVFHTWDWTQPPTITTKTVTTIHDFVPFLFPDVQHRRTINAFKSKLYWASRECSRFICVSQNTRTDLLRLFPQINPDQTEVVYEAPEDRYLQFIRLSTSQKLRKKSMIKKIYDLDHYLLAIGTREPRKNLDRLVTAFTQYCDRHPDSPYTLAIAGKYGWGQDTISSHPRIKILGYVSDRDIAPLLANATCLVYPSLYEGFGLPPLNAMTVGTPVITSHISSLPEVAGSAAVYLDPSSITDMMAKIEQVLASSTLRQRLRRLGITQSRKFSWTTTAKQTLRVYDSIFNL